MCQHTDTGRQCSSDNFSSLKVAWTWRSPDEAISKANPDLYTRVSCAVRTQLTGQIKRIGDVRRLARGAATCYRDSRIHDEGLTGATCYRDSRIHDEGLTAIEAQVRGFHTHT